MDFFIKKNSTLPLLKLQVVKNGRSDYDNFMKTIELSTIFFSMVDIETGVAKISSRPAGFVEKTFIDPNAEPEYYIYYQFTNRDTNKVGRYEGQFMLRTDDGVLILPIREKLFINIQESFIADDLPYENCYTSEFPCCDNGPYTTTTTTTPCPSCPTCPEPTPTPTNTQTPTPTNTQTPTPTNTPTNTPTPTPTPTENIFNPIITNLNEEILINDGDYLQY
jgi:cell division septation protein DedD